MVGQQHWPRKCLFHTYSPAETAWSTQSSEAFGL